MREKYLPMIYLIRNCKNGGGGGLNLHKSVCYNYILNIEIKIYTKTYHRNFHPKTQISIAIPLDWCTICLEHLQHSCLSILQTWNYILPQAVQGRKLENGGDLG